MTLHLKNELLLIFILAICQQTVSSNFVSANIKSNDEEMFPAEIMKGLEAGDKLLLATADPSASSKILPIMNRLALPFTIALGGLVNLFTDGMISLSAKKRASELLQEYNGRLVELNTDFREVTQLMEWSTVKVAFSQFEQSLLALEDSFSLVLNAPEENQEAQIAFFRTLFENDYKNAATKLFQSITNNNFLFSDNLFTAVKKATRNHRRLTRQFAMGIHNLVVLGAEMEIAYLKFSGIFSNQDFVSEYWGNNLETLKSVIDEVDKELFDSWEKNSKEDILIYLERFKAINDHRTFTNALSQILMDKYEWRTWLVMAYNPVSGYDEHAVLTCPNVWVFFRQNGRNLVVSSVDTENNSINFSASNAQMLIKDTVPTKFPSALQNDRPLFLLRQITSSLKVNYNEICQQKYNMIAVLSENTYYSVHAAQQHYITSMKVVKTFLKKASYHFILFG